MDEPEEWRSVVGHEGRYEVSSLGRVRSLDMAPGERYSRAAKPGRILKLNTTHTYLRVSLVRHRYAYVHHLVAEAFRGARPLPHSGPGRYEVNHRDGNKRNNRSDNLEWVTSTQNHLHAVDTGLHPMRGADNHQAKLDVAAVRMIRAEYQRRRPGLPHGNAAALAARFDVSIATVQSVVRRVKWRHVA